MIVETIKIKEMVMFSELFLGISIIYLVIYGTFLSFNKRNQYPLIQNSMLYLGVLILTMTCFLLINDNLIVLNYLSFSNSVANDYLSFVSKILIGIASFICLLMIQQYLVEQKINHFFKICYWLLVADFIVLGLFLLCSANDLITAYLAVILQSIIFYVLAAFKKNSTFSIEAGLKYFIIGAFWSGLFLFGSSLIYNITINLEDLFCWLGLITSSKICSCMEVDPDPIIPVSGEGINFAGIPDNGILLSEHKIDNFEEYCNRIVNDQLVSIINMPISRVENRLSVLIDYDAAGVFWAGPCIPGEELNMVWVVHNHCSCLTAHKSVYGLQVQEISYILRLIDNCPLLHYELSRYGVFNSEVHTLELLKERYPFLSSSSNLFDLTANPDNSTTGLRMLVRFATFGSANYEFKLGVPFSNSYDKVYPIAEGYGRFDSVAHRWLYGNIPMKNLESFWDPKFFMQFFNYNTSKEFEEILIKVRGYVGEDQFDGQLERMARHLFPNDPQGKIKQELLVKSYYIILEKDLKPQTSPKCYQMWNYPDASALDYLSGCSIDNFIW